MDGAKFKSLDFKKKTDYLSIYLCEIVTNTVDTQRRKKIMNLRTQHNHFSLMEKIRDVELQKREFRAEKKIILI